MRAAWRLFAVMVLQQLCWFRRGQKRRGVTRDGDGGGGGGRASLPGGCQMCDLSAVALQATATADSQREARGKPP